MDYALFSTAGERDYHGVVLDFLEGIKDTDVRGVVLVAISGDGPYVSWDCTPLDLAAAAAILQAQTTLNYMEGTENEDDC